MNKDLKMGILCPLQMPHMLKASWPQSEQFPGAVPRRERGLEDVTSV